MLPARAAGDAAAIHRSEIRLDLHHHHRAGRLRVVFINEGLVNPATGELQAVGNGSNQLGDGRNFLRHLGSGLKNYPVT
jgi:hypothetical protein